MSSPLKQNTTNLQSILDTINALPEAGINLPELTNPADADKTLDGYEFINAEGNVITGSMSNNGAISSTMDGLDVKSITIPEGYTSGGTVSLDSTIDDEVATQTELLTQAVAALEGKAAGGGSGSGSGSSTVETCTVTLSSTSTAAGKALIYHTVENGEVIMKTHYVSYSVSLTFPSVTCVKNSFLCWGDPTGTGISTSFSISGGIQQISHNINNTCGAVFKITGDCAISIS